MILLLWQCWITCFACNVTSFLFPFLKSYNKTNWHVMTGNAQSPLYFMLLILLTIFFFFKWTKDTIFSLLLYGTKTDALRMLLLHMYVSIYCKLDMTLVEYVFIWNKKKCMMIFFIAILHLLLENKYNLNIINIYIILPSSHVKVIKRSIKTFIKTHIKTQLHHIYN